MHVISCLRLQLSGESHSFARRKVSYDETNQRVRIVEQYDQENETRQYFDILYLYNEVYTYHSNVLWLR